MGHSLNKKSLSWILAAASALSACGSDGSGDDDNRTADGGSEQAGANTQGGGDNGGANGASDNGGTTSEAANGGGSGTSAGGTNAGGTSGTAGGTSGGTTGSTTVPPVSPPPGTGTTKCTIPSDANLEDVSKPTTVVGTGTAASCTGKAFVDAVAKGGVITFNCGPDPVTITLTQTAKVFNDKGPKIVIDGGGKVTLSGGGKVRILYQNTCDEAQVYTTPTCQNQDHPQLTVQNLNFVDGNSKGQTPPGGGAIFVRGGRLKIINSRFFHNICEDTGPDVGGGAVRALSQFNGLPVYVVGSTFGGSAELGNVCSNGGALSGLYTSYTVINSTFSHNLAIGNGANPMRNGTPGGGSGGAIYNDGQTFHLKMCGVDMQHHVANEGGGAIFFVSNDSTGTLTIEHSTLKDNLSKGFETPGYPGIFYKSKGTPTVTASTIEK